MAEPVLIRYTSGDTTVEIPAYYEGGLEGLFVPGAEKGMVRLICFEPLWKLPFQTGTTLSTSQSLTYARILERENYAWGALGSPSVATGGIWAVAYAPNRDLYVGGTFTDLDGVASADRIARYNRTSGAWEAVSSGLNGKVWDLAFDAAGNLYAAGEFTDAGGVAAADYIAKWDGSSWSALGTPLSGTASITRVRSLAFDSSGNLYIGGSFTDFAGITAADNVAKWDGSSWSALGTASPNGEIYSVVVDSQDNLYVGGNFTALVGGGAISDHIAKWDGSSWISLTNGLSSYVESLAISISDEVYIVGNFAQDADASATLNYVAKWDGQAFLPLGSGFYDYGYEIAVSPSGRIWACGTFSDDGGVTIVSRLVTWSGSTWEVAEVELTSGTVVRDFDFFSRLKGEDIALATNSADTITVYGLTSSISNNGSAPAYPVIKIKRSGGNSAKLQILRNVTSGLELQFDLGIQDGETIRIDLVNKTIRSNFRGNLVRKLLPQSDFQDFALLPGENDIYLYVSEAGSPTITATMQWRECYWSVDDI